MIEKPKRPKKPDIQERQPPRTLQELISRYDLDNTKIYDFLDGLVELLNTEKESIDISINNLNNKKVNKSGDTLTGELQFNNKNDYAAIRKTRTINGVDYNVNIGVGANQSGRMEFQDANNNVLCSVEARSGGIYNGVSGKKLAEQSTGWTNATKTSYLGSGTFKYTKIGNIVIVTLYDIIIAQDITQHATILATGLPKAIAFQMGLLINYDTGARFRVGITESGNFQNHWSNVNASNNSSWYGTLIYITNE